MRRLGRAVLLGAGTGAALVCVAPPHELYPLVFVAFIPLLRVSDARCGAAAAGLAGWVAGVTLYLGVFRWLPHAIAALQGVNAAAAWTLFAVFTALHAVQFALAAAVAAKLVACAPPCRGALATAAVWVLLEWSFPKVFPWSIGAALGPEPLLRQTAALGGVYGLALLVVLVNALLATATQFELPPAQRLLASGVALGVLALALLFGAWRQGALARARQGMVVRVAVVQGGVPPAAGGLRFDGTEGLATYAALTRAAAAAADLIVWPESALRVYLRDDDEAHAQLVALVEGTQRPLLLGALDRDAVAAGELNAAYRYLPSATEKAAAVYHKAALLPFGEYLPGAAWWPALRRFWRTTGDFVPGGAPAPLTMRLGAARLSMAPSICFEAILPGAFNDLVRGGAGLLVNLTDDGWFASQAAAAQHLELTRLRAVESGRWLARASNSGISAFIDPSGRVVRTLPFGAVGTLCQPIDLREAQTPYVRYGNWVLPLCGGLAALPLVDIVRLRRDRRAAAPPDHRR